jgi:hypothetical protein
MARLYSSRIIPAGKKGTRKASHIYPIYEKFLSNLSDNLVLYIGIKTGDAIMKRMKAPNRKLPGVPKLKSLFNLKNK